MTRNGKCWLYIMLILVWCAVVCGAAWIARGEETPGTYELYALPPIRESECPSDLFVAHVMRVELDEADLRENERLRVMLGLPYSASQVFAVYLTDWEHWVPPDMEETGESALRLTFESAAVRVISDGAWVYLLVIAIL